MKYLKLEEQLKLLKNKEYEKLYAYAEVHNLHQCVVRALISQIKEMEDKHKVASIH